jgi:hypothetical protein
MPCVLDLTGNDIRAAKGSSVNLLIIGNNYSLRQVSVTTTDAAGNVTTTDFSSSIDPTRKTVTVKVLEGTNTVVMTFFPPPAAETLDIVEDCGGAGNTQPILRFGAGTRAGANFKVIAS